MRIRLREFAPHIIAMTIVFIFMVGASIFYTSLVKTTIISSSSDQVKKYAQAQIKGFIGACEEERKEYLLDPSGYEVVIFEDEDYSNQYGFFLLSEKEAENINSEDLYFYIRLDQNSNKYIKKSYNSIYKLVPMYNAEKFGAVSSNGLIYEGHDLASNSTFYQQLLDSRTSNEIKDDFKSFMADNSRTVNVIESSYSNLASLKGNEYYIGVSRISRSMYFVTLFDAKSYEGLIIKSNNLNLVYAFTLALTFSIIFVDLALIVLRSNRILTIRSSASARHGTAIIRINKKGKVKFYARGRDSFGIEVNDLNIFIPVSGKTFEESLKTENRFIASYEDDANETQYAEFVIVPHQGGYVVISNIITQDYKKDVELKQLTEHNQISNLPNRNALFKDFESLKGQFFKQQVTLAKIKLVEFESVSKTLGYSSGDKLLLEAIKIIQGSLDKNSFIYQDENDTLIVILTGTYQRNDQVINKFLNLFNKPIQLVKSTIFVHLKIGTIELKNVFNNDFDLKDALEKVSVALNYAQEKVSVSVVKYDSNLEIYINYRNQMEKDMREAIDSDEFVMYYQPQYNIHDRRIEGFESLIRWDNPKYKGVSPQVYIELAEKNGDIVEIGRFINREVFKAAKTFEKYGVHLSINVSPAQLIQSGFIDELLTEFKKNELKKGSVCVEITETYVMQNYTLMIEKLNILRNTGFSIHLDDFGTGYSSMLYLKELPIDTIKTDMEFIRNLESDQVSQVIESQVIKIAKSLDLKVICEGVERPTQVELLQKYGADYLQGYLVSKAVPMEKALDMVRNGVTIPGLKEGSR